MPIRWNDERGVTWSGGERRDEALRAAQRWRLRVVSDPRRPRVGGAPLRDFDAVIDAELRLWFRPFGVDSPYQGEVDHGGVSIQLVANITGGVRHEVSVRARPSVGDDQGVRWSCSCGASSRGDLSAEIAREGAEAHAILATDGRRRLHDQAVAQQADGTWARRDVAIIHRYHARVRSDLSSHAAHRKGNGEDLELAVDGMLGLWVRRLGRDAPLRRDEDTRGLSVIAFDGVW